MLFVVAFSSSLLAALVWTLSSDLGAHARVSIQSQVNDYLEQDVDVTSNTRRSSNWAGAVWDMHDGTFDYVIGTFTVPTPSGSDGAGAAAWVGIDGNTCTSGLFQTGVTFVMENGRPTYNAWYEWVPAPSNAFSNMSVSAGDVLKLSVVAWSANSGTATIENLTNGQLVSKNLNSSAALCGQNAEWIVEDYVLDINLVPFADFGTVAFTNAVARGTGTYYPAGSIVYNIKQNKKVLTNVSTNGDSVTIEYV